MLKITFVSVIFGISNFYANFSTLWDGFVLVASYLLNNLLFWVRPAITTASLAVPNVGLSSASSERAQMNFTFTEFLRKYKCSLSNDLTSKDQWAKYAYLKSVRTAKSIKKTRLRFVIKQGLLRLLHTKNHRTSQIVARN